MKIDTYPTAWFDFHCHFCDIISYDNADIISEIEAACKVGVTKFYSSAYRKDQFDWHLAYTGKDMEWYAGIHPMFVEETKDDVNLIPDLAKQNKIIAIGEIGLDSRYDTLDLQERLLLSQLEIAQSFDLPVVFHSVGKYYDLYKIIKNNFPKTRGILHSFASSDEVFQIFKSLGFGFSLGAPLLTSRNHEKVMKNILEWGLFMLETDAPAQKPFFVSTEFNKLSYLPEIALRLAQSIDIDPSILQRTAWKSLYELGFEKKEIE